MIEIQNSASGNYIVTHAIGASYVDNWKKNSLPSWIEYCTRNDIGIVLVDRPIPAANKKNLYWEKLLIPSCLRTNKKIVNICYLDTDVLINPYAENIFHITDQEKVNLVSQFYHLPYPSLTQLQKKIAFLRNKYLDKNYPLNSSLFMPKDEIYRYHNLEVMPDYACMGLFVLNIEKYANFFSDRYAEVSHDIQTIDGGEEVFLNYFIQKNLDTNWLDYKWQAIWMFEMSYNYSFLYKKRNDQSLIKECVINTLYNNSFLHFAGSWESFAWHSCGSLYECSKDFDNLGLFQQYLNAPIDWAPRGQIRPSKK